MVSPGNHEANCVNGGQKNKKMHITYDETYCLEGQTEFKFYREHFRMPSSSSKGLENFWYSYDYGLVSPSAVSASSLPPIAEARPITGSLHLPHGRN